MSITYACDSCGDLFCYCGDGTCDCGGTIDCGYWVECDCGKKWCDYKCAERDGFKENYCKLRYRINHGCPCPCDERCNKECCRDCESFVKRSCSYCRREKFTEKEMLEKALELLRISKEEFIKGMRESNENFKIQNVE